MKYTRIFTTAFVAFALAFVVLPQTASAQWGEGDFGPTGDEFGGGSAWGSDMGDYGGSTWVDQGSEMGDYFGSASVDQGSDMGDYFGSASVDQGSDMDDYYGSAWVDQESEMGDYFGSASVDQFPGYSNNYPSPSQGSIGGIMGPLLRSACGSSCTTGGISRIPGFTTSNGFAAFPSQPGRPLAAGGSSPSLNYLTNYSSNTQGQSQNSANTNTSNSSSSANSSSNATTGNNVNNNVNNNNVVVNVPAATYNPNPHPNPNPVQNLVGACTISPSYGARIGQDLVFTATASGGQGAYAFSWTGSDGISSNSQTFTGRFYSYGQKYATVRITSGSQSISATCNVNIENTYVTASNVTVVRGSYDQVAPVSGVYLNQVPATGISGNSMKVILFSTGLLLWGAFIASVMISKRKIQLATAGADRIAAFKQMNLTNRG